MTMERRYELRTSPGRLVAGLQGTHATPRIVPLSFPPRSPRGRGRHGQCAFEGLVAGTNLEMGRGDPAPSAVTGTWPSGPYLVADDRGGLRRRSPQDLNQRLRHHGSRDLRRNP